VNELEENGQEAAQTGGPDPLNDLKKGPKVVVYVICGLLCIFLIVVLYWVVWMFLTDNLGDPFKDDNKTDLSEDADIKRYEQGKVASAYMDEGDMQMDEARSIYNKLDQNVTALVEKMVNGQPVDVGESIGWIRTLEGKARASLAEAGSAYDRILGMEWVEDYRDYVRMQKDLISLYGQLLAAQEDLLAFLEPAAASGQVVDAGELTQSGLLEVITGLTRDIDEATRLSEAFKLENDL
jgi:hypothetical protein